MSIFGKLFKKPESPKQNAEVPRPSSDPADDPNLIRVFDKYGQELFISKDQWRTSVLPGTIKSQWDSPDQLYGIIIGALDDGFITDVLGAAEQLYRLDPNSSRAACLYGIVLMKNGRLDEAERVLRSFLEEHGEDGVVLTNLAKVYADRNEMQKAEATLWHALEVDPNQDNGVAWYESLNRERFGEEAGLNALRRLAVLPGSWRAQVWLARAALKSQDLEQALVYYRESLSRAGKNIPADLLMQISGDLGNHAHPAELLNLTEPHFVPEHHGLQVGNNLIKAHIELGHLDDARRILDRLYSLKRPDWRKTLGYWDTEIAKVRIATSKVQLSGPLNMIMFAIEGPVWLKPASPAAKLFPSNAQDDPVISFLGSTATMAAPSQEIQKQMSDAPGRMSRALPLFLAEQVRFACQAKVQTLIPWIAEGAGGFVLSGVAWSNEEAVEFVRKSETKSDYVVVTHLNTQSDPWIVDLRVLRAGDGECVGKIETSFASSNPGERVSELSQRLLTLLAKQANAKIHTPSALYQLPDAAHMSNYLLRLEQLLAVRCAEMDGVSPNFLNGEREIVDGNLQLCLACPENVATRILLAQTLLTMNKVRPEVVQEFSDKVAFLQKEKPLREPAQSVVQEMLIELIAP